MLLLISSERGQIYSFATPKLQPILVNENSKQLIEQCLNAPDPMALPPAPMPALPETAAQMPPQPPPQAPPAAVQQPAVQHPGMPAMHVRSPPPPPSPPSARRPHGLGRFAYTPGPHPPSTPRPLAIRCGGADTWRGVCVCAYQQVAPHVGMAPREIPGVSGLVSMPAATYLVDGQMAHGMMPQ